MTDIKTSFTKRKKRITAALANEKPDRVPIVSMVANYVYYIYGYKPIDAFDNTGLMEHVYRRFYTEQYFDGFQINPVGKGKFDTAQILDGGTSQYLPDGSYQTKPGSVNVMDPKEYDQLIACPHKYFIEKIFPRRYKLFNQTAGEQTYEQFKAALLSMQESGKATRPVADMLMNDLGLFNLTLTLTYNPVDVILDFLRDFNGIMQDIKRRPDAVRDAGMSILNWCLQIVEMTKPDPDRVITIPMHLPTFLSPKDFEKVYWPSFKKLAEELVARGYRVFYLFERKYEHLLDYLQELPKNKVAGHFEHDDLLLIKQKLGKTMCIVGGMPTNLLYYNSKEECIAYIKKVIDHVAVDGGFILSADKPMIGLTDGKLENFRAVNEFVQHYGVYRQEG